MKKLFLTILLLLLLLTACNPNINKDFKIQIMDQYNAAEENPFLKPIAGSDTSKTGNFSFMLVTDTHIGKQDGIRVDDTFISWLEDNGKAQNIAFIVNLGDITDNAEAEEFNAFENNSLTPWKKYTESDLFIPVLGNHDNRLNGPEIFKQTFTLNTTYYRFDYGDVEFYILDTSFRTLGRQQLALFEEAMERPTDKPRIILSHVPLHGSDSVIYAAMTDSTEVRRIVQAMRRGGARTYLSGHQHKGEITHEYKGINPSESINELIASCFFGGTIRNFTPRFYICTYRSAERALVIDVYSYDGSEYKKEEAKYTFPL